MVRLRFRRVGLKGQPSYRIVVTDQRNQRDGSFIEIIGHHNPRTQPSTDVINEARALYWLSVGAQPTDAVRQLLKRTGTLERYERVRKGESIEAVAADAPAADVSPRTRYDSPEEGKGTFKPKAS